ncbi:MAG: hypothetical protein Q7T16_00495 [Candidatus Burarchaeum sp.]|nr:hypothetical protein [Candidatus Burarchaeum sp.]MDO8339117.1 hypothetical protein [Candidatus Burarchaeum sp.]
MADDKKAEKGGEKKGGAGTAGSGGGKKPQKKKFKLYKKLRACPKCGTGTRLAEHPDRFACGKCGYMERKGKA